MLNPSPLFSSSVTILRSVLIPCATCSYGTNYISKQFSFTFPQSFSMLSKEARNQLLILLDSKMLCLYHEHLAEFTRMPEGKEREKFYKTHIGIRNRAAGFLTESFLLQDNGTNETAIRDAYQDFCVKCVNADQQELANRVYDVAEDETIPCETTPCV